MAFLKNIWKTNSKHQKLSELSEELALQSPKQAESEPMDMMENESDVMTFKLKYLGSTVIEKITGDNVSTEAVKNIIKVTKAGRKKLQRVNISVCLKGIAVTDMEGNEKLKISIYRISNCATDPTHRQVFSFISTDSNETMECHAFICPKRRMAETVTLAVAHAFGTAYEAWRVLPSTKEFEKNATTPKEDECSDVDQGEDKKLEGDIVEEKLIDFDEPVSENQSFTFATSRRQDDSNSHWVCFDDDFVPQKRSVFKPDLIMT